MATRRRSSKTMRIRSGLLRGSIYWVILVLGSVCCYKTIIPKAQEHFLVSSGSRYTPSFGGLGPKTLALFEAEVKTEGGSTATGTSLDAMVVASTGGGVFSQ